MKNSNINTRSYNINYGFSLLELSIVLTVVGLLVIGIIRGYALVSASKIITLTNELTKYSFAAEQFNAKYGNLPGIIDNPQKLFGSKAKYKIDEDKIDTNAINESASLTNAESINFFNHLYLSGLLGDESGVFVGTDNNLSNVNEITKDSNYYPTLNSIKSMFVYVRGDDVDGSYNKTNRLTVSSYNNKIIGINADLIYGLDLKVDDGLPLSGLISIVPMKVLNYGSDDKSDGYSINKNNNNMSFAYVNIIMDYFLSPLLLTENMFNILKNANAENINDNSTSCLILDKTTGEIKYNTKGKNCFILRNIDSTQQSKITDLGLNGATGEFCTLSINDDYPNAESVVGITMLNGTKKAIKCNDGYTGNIIITCKDGDSMHSGDTKCIFNGCKKYDNKIINDSFNAILTTNDVVNWDNINEEDKNNLSSNDGITYNKNDIIATLSCKEKDGYNLRDGSNGYSIKCDGNNNIVVDNNGGCEYDNSGGCIGFPIVKSNTHYNRDNYEYLLIEQRDGCNIIQGDSALMYDDSSNQSFDSGNYLYNEIKNYRFLNGTTIDMSCQSGYLEYDGCGSDSEIGHDDDLIDCTSGNCSACWYLHYYECKDNQWVARGGCKVNTCSVGDLTEEIFGNNLIKTIVKCNDETCSNIDTNEIVDITTEEGRGKKYDFGAIITINTCSDGYSTLNKRIMRCNENGNWEIYNNTENNMCVFTGCNDMSAVFDKNNNKVSEQLYDMTFGSDNTLTSIYSLLYCHDYSKESNYYVTLGTNSNWVVSINTDIKCADTVLEAISNTKDDNRIYTCMADTTNINNGKSYWKINKVSCDLGVIKGIANKGYTAYLNSSASNVLLNEKTTQYRYLNTTYWSKLYTNQIDNFTLTCNSSGNWEMTKTVNSCQGVPTLVSGSNFYPSNDDIMYVDGQTGILVNATDLKVDTSSKLTKDKLLGNTGKKYFVSNGTKIEGSCDGEYQEVDKNNISNSNSSADRGGHYYECVKNDNESEAKWVARGGCALKVDYYSPRLYDDVNKTGTISASKYVNVDDNITCSTDFFEILDPDNGTLKICAINGYRVAVENETFIVKIPDKHNFCHKSYIPRDLGAGLNGSAGVDGWCNNKITKDTYKGDNAKVSNEDSFIVNHSDTGVSASGILMCNNGTWKIKSGQMTFEYTGSVKTFCVPYGLKDAGKSITFELWGAQGDPCYDYGRGGYTMGIMNNGNYNNKQEFYVVVGEAGQLSTNTDYHAAYNGGGKSLGYDGDPYYGGGGASHIANKSGLLSSLSGNNDVVLLVAGAGGGSISSSSTCKSKIFIGGYGGGGDNNNNDGGVGGRNYNGGGGAGGTQNSGGVGHNSAPNGSFGQGGSCDIKKCAGGGGGYYGGGASRWKDNNTGHGGGGGSGYCNTSKFSCSGSNGQRSGNGYVKISW